MSVCLQVGCCVCVRLSERACSDVHVCMHACKMCNSRRRMCEAHILYVGACVCLCLSAWGCQCV